MGVPSLACGALAAWSSARVQKTGIGEAGVLQLAQGVLVQIQAIVLVVGAFVPLEPQPGQIVNQLSGKFRLIRFCYPKGGGSS